MLSLVKNISAFHGGTDELLAMVIEDPDIAVIVPIATMLDCVATEKPPELEVGV